MKKAKNLPKNFKNSDDFAGLQLEMWQILCNFFQKSFQACW
jgi:hypothetical protein